MHLDSSHSYTVSHNAQAWIRLRLYICINGRKIDLVKSYKHLGHVINSTFNDREDIADKRGAFVGQGNNVICYFHKLDSNIRQQLFDIILH